MVHLKTEKELRVMQTAGRKLRKVVDQLLPQIKKGITTEEIDKKAETLILNQNGKPSFKSVKNYRWSTCLTVNEQVVHTPPSKRSLKEGDILTVDIGLCYKDFHTDFATTFCIGKYKDDKIKKFIEVGKATLDEAIKKAGRARYIGEISSLIGERIYGNGYFVMKELTGHGIGRSLHEEPFVPGFLNGPVEKTYKIREGLAIAIEIIYSMGTEEIEYERGSDWSIKTIDNSISACFEHTVAFGREGLIRIT